MTKEQNKTRDAVPIAHVRQDEHNQWHIHLLADHLQGVAHLAGNFAQAFGAEDWASLAGLWHDLGKYRPAFQARIRKVSGFDPEAHLEGGDNRPDHSIAGAKLAIKRLGPQGRILAYMIAGHHAGLPDWNGKPSALFQRLENQAEAWLQEALGQNPPEVILDSNCPTSRPPGGALHLWIRLLFSCLVDADFLDTEAFMEPAKANQRGKIITAQELLVHFDAHMMEKAANAEATPVNRIRNEVLSQCRDKAKADKPGLFSLTVPTGGGKTLSSMAFALEHAKQYGKRKIIYAIPYTSIIEQTAEIFRGIFGEVVIRVVPRAKFNYFNVF